MLPRLHTGTGIIHPRSFAVATPDHNNRAPTRRHWNLERKFGRPSSSLISSEQELHLDSLAETKASFKGGTSAPSAASPAAQHQAHPPSPDPASLDCGQSCFVCRLRLFLSASSSHCLRRRSTSWTSRTNRTNCHYRKRNQRN